MNLDLLLNLKRNDFRAALKVAQELAEENELTFEIIRLLLRLQDEPEELEEPLRAMLKKIGYIPKR